MKSLVLVLIGAAIAAGGYILYTESQKPSEQEPVEQQIVESVPSPAPEAKPEPTATVVTPEPVPASIPTEVDFAERASKPFTTLTDKQGREILAKVLSVNGDQIKLRRNDGLETTIPLGMLSEADVAFCEYLRANAPQLAEVPSPTTGKPSQLDPKLLEAQGGIDWDAIFGE